MSEIRAALEERARLHNHGVITRKEALAAGLPVSQVDRRVRRKQWRTSGHRGWLILADCWDDPVAHLTCAVGALDGMAWRRSGLALHGIRSHHPNRPDVLSRRQDRSETVAVGRYDPTVWRVVLRAGLPCLTLEDTVASMAGISHPDRFDELVDSVILDQRTDWTALAVSFKRIRRQGRLGSAMLGRVLDERGESTTVPLSIWSRKFIRALDDTGLPRPQMEWRVEREGHLIAQVDLAYPDIRYAIELDSVSYHLSREAFEEDRRRDSDLAVAGWLVRRFTWKQFDERFHWVVRTIIADVESRSHLRSTSPPGPAGTLSA